MQNGYFRLYWNPNIGAHFKSIETSFQVVPLSLKSFHFWVNCITFWNFLKIPSVKIDLQENYRDTCTPDQKDMTNRMLLIDPWITKLLSISVKKLTWIIQRVLHVFKAIIDQNPFTGWMSPYKHTFFPPFLFCDPDWPLEFIGLFKMEFQIYVHPPFPQ
jgi:hypothetical protein